MSELTWKPISTARPGKLLLLTDGTFVCSGMVRAGSGWCDLAVDGPEPKWTHWAEFNPLEAA